MTATVMSPTLMTATKMTRHDINYIYLIENENNGSVLELDRYNVTLKNNTYEM